MRTYRSSRDHASGSGYGNIQHENYLKTKKKLNESSTLPGETESNRRYNPFQHAVKCLGPWDGTVHPVPGAVPTGPLSCSRPASCPPSPQGARGFGESAMCAYERPTCPCPCPCPRPAASAQDGARGRACSAEHRARARHVVGAQPGRVHVRSDLEVRRLLRVRARLA